MRRLREKKILVSNYIKKIKEKNFQSDFNKWVKGVYKKTAAFELKITKGPSLSFDAVKPHQEAALDQAKNRVLVYKIVDCGYQNPFDSLCLAGVPAYVVIKYPDFFCLIDIDDWLNEKQKSDRKSLTSGRAREIATVIHI